ncbi:hypothetical protein CHS0354_030876, partial [Potamilus streckersoni]
MVDPSLDSTRRGTSNGIKQSTVASFLQDRPRSARSPLPAGRGLPRTKPQTISIGLYEADLLQQSTCKYSQAFSRYSSFPK